MLINSTPPGRICDDEDAGITADDAGDVIVASHLMGIGWVHILTCMSARKLLSTISAHGGAPEKRLGHL